MRHRHADGEYILLLIRRFGDWTRAEPRAITASGDGSQEMTRQSSFIARAQRQHYHMMRPPILRGRCRLLHTFSSTITIVTHSGFIKYQKDSLLSKCAASACSATGTWHRAAMNFARRAAPRHDAFFAPSSADARRPWAAGYRLGGIY